MLYPKLSKDRRVRRVRSRIRERANGRARLSVFRSGKHIYAQIIDDAKGVTVAAASSIEKGADVSKGKAVFVGAKVAERAVASGTKSVVFDRGYCAFHGNIKLLADSARAGGLEF